MFWCLGVLVFWVVKDIVDHFPIHRRGKKQLSLGVNPQAQLKLCGKKLLLRQPLLDQVFSRFLLRQAQPEVVHTLSLDEYNFLGI